MKAAKLLTPADGASSGAVERARRAVAAAVRDGLLVRPQHCSLCGQRARRIVGHHRDYSHPLAVVWCCAPCHGIEHASEPGDYAGIDQAELDRRVLDAVGRGHYWIGDIAREVGGDVRRARRGVQITLRRLAQEGRVERYKHTRYRLAGAVGEP